MIKWIESFLSDRIQYVYVNGRKSKPARVNSGVPQGSVLGPLLFLIMVGDIDSSLKYSFLSSFADDTRVLKEINSLTDTLKLQSDLNRIYKWTVDNNMKLNGCKFEHLNYGKDKVLKQYSTYLSNSSTRITTKDTVKDLGVLMSNDCKFTNHICNIITRANSIVGWILRTFESREKLLMLTLWKSLVIPHLDYCSQLWSPLTKGHIQDIEIVQRNYVRKIVGITGISYWDALRKLKMYSLERRRERYMIIYTWKVIEHLVPNINRNANVRGITWNLNGRLGRKCVVPLVRKGPYQTSRYASFAVQGPRLFNCLPRKLRDMSNCDVKSFKAGLDTFLSTVPDEPQIPSYVQFRRAPSNSITDMMCIGLTELDA